MSLSNLFPSLCLLASSSHLGLQCKTYDSGKKNKFRKHFFSFWKVHHSASALPTSQAKEKAAGPQPKGQALIPAAGSEVSGSSTAEGLPSTDYF